MSTGFISEQERLLGEAFLRDGHVIRQAEDTDALGRIRDRIVAIARTELGVNEQAEPQSFLDGIHRHVPIERLNDFRLAVIAGINREPWVREAYYRLAEKSLQALVGNELAMQRRLNLSIQFPEDDSSLLPPHTDTWSGDSPFELVLWVPLVDCHDTKSMFLLPPKANARIAPGLAKYEEQGVDALFREHEADFLHLKIDYGQVLLFDQNLIHGNRVNREPSTRWSFNCRFKGLFTPYTEKRLGEFFEPITMRPMTRIGLDYRLPEDFRV